MRTLAVANQKGGSGKTTTAVNLAAALAESGRRVLILDLDPQGSTSNWFRVEETERGLLGVLTDGESFEGTIKTTETQGVAVIPASPWLVAADKLLAEKDQAQMLLRSHLPDSDRSAWDYVLMDCPPNLGLLTVNALGAVREVLIPVAAQILPLHGLSQLLKTIDVVKERLNPELEVSGILACRVDGRTRLAREVVGDLRDRFRDKVFEAVIRENVRLAECPSFGKPITTYATRSHGATDFRALAREVIRQERRVLRG